MLGEAFYHQFKDDYELRCSDIDLNEDWLNFLDFREFDEYKNDVFEFKPDYLFHLGAYTDLEYCENNPDDTYITNTLAVENAVNIANHLGIPLLYISTAGIFDGKQKEYDDWDTPNPLGVYARSKYIAEKFVCENANQYLVCRAGWMMGGGPNKDKKFVNKIIKQISSGATSLHIVNDKDGTPTYTLDFAKTVRALVEYQYWGLYNCVCGGQTGRLDVAKEILKILNRSDEIEIIPVNSDYFKNIYFAERPASERLVTKKLNLRRLNFMRDWKVTLDEYLNDRYSESISK